jgi:hypothetical protein
MKTLLTLLFFASPVPAAPKIDVLAAKPDPAKPEVVLTVTVTKSGGNCDVRVDFGDGKGRTLDFGLATTRTLRYAYAKGGNYKVSAKGAGKTPCEGAKEIALSLKGPAEKKAPEKKAPEKKKAEKKKADKKSASKKQEEPK